MTPFLDVRTMVLIYVCIRIGQAAMLVYLWRVQQNYPPAKDWAVGALMSAAGLLCLALRDLAPVWVTEILANALLLPGWMIFDYGIARAAGKKPSVKLGLLLCALAIGSLAWHSFVEPDRAARIFVHHMVLAAFDFYAAYACLCCVKSGRRITFRLIAALLFLLVLSYLWRIADDVFAITLLPLAIPSRVFLVAVSTVIFPMITMLLALQTSQRLQEEMNAQARLDMLTGAFNRRAFDEFVNSEWSRTVRYGYPFSVLMVDIDHFKKFNDQYGHQAGDAALVQVSNAAQAAFRANDVWCRYGGEEFVALLPNTTLEQAPLVAERLRCSVEKTTISAPGGSLSLSVSIGVAERFSTHAHWAELLAAADSALYKAKATGRNRVLAV